MANVNIKFNGKEFLLSCDDGQEEHLEELSLHLNKKFNGANSLEYLPNDQASDQENRYYAKLKHYHDFDNGFSGGYNVEKVSDDNYFSDMSSLITVTSQVNLNQEVYLNYLRLNH